MPQLPYADSGLDRGGSRRADERWISVFLGVRAEGAMFAGLRAPDAAALGYAKGHAPMAPGTAVLRRLWRDDPGQPRRAPAIL